jgi:Spy/CpxP family protein refolding chaperone
MKNFVITLLFALCATVAFAQGEEREANERVKVISEELSLTDEQKTKVMEAMKKRRIAVKEAQEMNRKARREAHEAFDEDMKSILTAEQLKKFEERKEDMSTPQGRAERLVGRMDKHVDLTDEQAKKVEAAALTRFTKLSELEKGKENKAARDAVNAAFDAELKTILTAEQLKKYENMKPGHGKGGNHGKGGGGKGKGGGRGK